MVVTCGIDRMAGVYSAAHMDDARAIFLFRPRHQLDLWIRGGYAIRSMPSSSAARCSRVTSGVVMGLHVDPEHVAEPKCS